MADRKPVVLLPNNSLAELPAGDSLAWSLLSGVPVYATRWPTWDEVSGKPTTFTPATHTHTIAQVTGLQAALDGKAAASHTHEIAQVTGLQAALDGKAAASHTHSIAQVSGLQSALDGKAAASHTHGIAQVTGLQAALDGKLDRVVEYSLPDANSLPTGNFLGNLYGEVTSNTPTGSWTQIIQSTNGNKTWGFQLAKPWFQDELYLRSRANGGWSNWFRIWHSGNQPRIFVQAGDPGSAAKDGDIWIQP